MVIGGIAVIARGVRRFTADIDVAIRGDEIELPELLKALGKKRIVPRVSDAVELARTNLVLLLRHDPTGVDFDVSFAWTSFEHDAIAASSVEAFGAVRAPMAQPDDLIVFKSIAARPERTIAQPSPSIGSTGRSTYRGAPSWSSAATWGSGLTFPPLGRVRTAATAHHACPCAQVTALPHPIWLDLCEGRS